MNQLPSKKPKQHFFYCNIIYTSITISQLLYCSLIPCDEIKISIVCEFSSCNFTRSVYTSSTNHIFLSQASVQQIKVSSVLVSGQLVQFMELYRYIIVRLQIVIVPFALYVCALEKMPPRNADTAFVSNYDHDYNQLYSTYIQSVVQYSKVRCINVLATQYQNGINAAMDIRKAS